MKGRTSWLKTGAVARLLGISRMTVIRMCEDGTLRAVQDSHSGHWLVDYDSVQDYLQARQPA